MKFDGRSFTAAEVVRITTVPYDTLNYWARIGLVKPSVSIARGSGSRRVYNFQDLVAIRVALKLRRAGIFGKALVRILTVIRKAGFDSPAEVAIDITPSGDVSITSKAGESFSARHRPGQLLLNFNCDCRRETAALRKFLRKELRSPEPRRVTKKGVKRAELQSPETQRRKA